MVTKKRLYTPRTPIHVLVYVYRTVRGVYTFFETRTLKRSTPPKTSFVPLPTGSVDEDEALRGSELLK
jgi:hypothetical protein